MHIRRKQKTPHCRGFSLVELLVVIAIVGVLVAMVLPSLAKSRVIAQQMACASNQRQIGVAIWAYAGDWSQYGPVDDSNKPVDGVRPSTGQGTNGGKWAWMLTSYLNHDPNDSYPEWSSTPRSKYVMNRVKLYQCPSTWLKLTTWNNNSYGANPYAFNMSVTATDFKKMVYSFKLSSPIPSKHGTDMLMTSESISANNIYTVWNSARVIDFVHNQMSNALLLDGHVTAKSTNVGAYPYFLTWTTTTTFSTPGTPYEVWGPYYQDPYP